MLKYITVTGDTWDMISYKLYDTEKHAKELVEANLDYVNVIIFSGDVELNVPEITEPISEQLPPWKRGINNASS